MASTRRDAIGLLAAFIVWPLTQRDRAKESPMLAMSNRAHVLVRPSAKNALMACFAEVLDCGVPTVLNAPGLAEPILAFQFPGGGSISFEFTDEAPDVQQAGRGAWLELQSDNPDALRNRVVEAGLAQA